MKPCVRDYERDKKIMMLREQGGLSYIKIGKRLGLTKGRVRILYLRMIEETIQLNKEMGIG